MMSTARVRTVSIEEAQADLAGLFDQVLAGQEVVIAREAQSMRLVRDVPAEPPPKRSLLGAMKGRLGDIGEEAMAPLPDEYLGLDLWSGKPL